MRSGVGAMSLLFNNTLQILFFLHPFRPETSIEKGCFNEISILYRSLYVNDMLKVTHLLI